MDSVERLARVDAVRILAYTPPTAHAYFAEVSKGWFQLRPQTDGDLGQRMSSFFAEQLQAGAMATVLVGSDSPSLPPGFIHQAFQELERADVVIGPSTDGGYYLVGCALLRIGQVPPLFDGIAWSTSRVLADTMGSLGDRGWRLSLLPPWYDVDTLGDWRMLQGHVAAMRRAGLDPELPSIERLLQEGL
jgi:rSAM/selenodomain-associated transferase 1